MGIQYLNSYIKNNVSNNSIQKISLFNLYNKIISVDISIYLYKFMNDGDLIENFYNMLCTFHYYNIYPIFVFDGKPPPEKNNLIERRKNEKNIAKIKFDKLKDKLNNNEIKETNEIYEIKNIMDSLKKKFNKLNYNDIDDIKKLISAFNYIYIQAESEADNICAKLVENNIAYACLSEDMDMFLYGCKRVLRYFSLTNHCAIIYNLYDILNELNISFKDFKEICILSGTDYNCENKKYNFYKLIKFYNMYKISNYNNFYLWLQDNTELNTNIKSLNNISDMFLLNNIEIEKYNIQIQKNYLLDYKCIENILTPRGFIFV